MRSFKEPATVPQIGQRVADGLIKQLLAELNIGDGKADLFSAKQGQFPALV